MRYATAHVSRFFPRAPTTDGSVLKPFYAALAQAAVDAGAMVQSVAIKYRSGGGSLYTSAPFIDDQSLVKSFGLVIEQVAIRAELILSELFSAQKTTRREVIRRSRRFIAHALGLPQFDTKLEPSALMRYLTLRGELPESKAVVALPRVSG